MYHSKPKKATYPNTVRFFLRWLVMCFIAFSTNGMSASVAAIHSASELPELPWSGVYVDFGDWIFHNRHGWQYWPAQATEEGHFYDFGIGAWGWSTPEAWPAVYLHEPISEWFVDKAPTSGQRRFFHPRSGSFVSEESLRTVWNIRELSIPPRPVYQPAPVYPPEMRFKGISGEVTLEFVVTSEGTVRDITVVDASRDEFIDPTIDAVGQWWFLPGTVGGVEVNTRVRIRIPFVIDSEPEPDPHPPN